MTIHPNAGLLTGALVLWAVFVTGAQASMPVLTPTPDPASPAGCQRWAASQDEDAIDMWGVQEAGGSSKPVAIARLTASCLGKSTPAIVSFGSSAGFDEAYCAKHRGAGVCRKS